MRLLNFKVTNYRCVDDSGVIDVDPKVTCLVGKNESGKTTLLYALHRLNPIGTPEVDPDKDYPSKGSTEYNKAVAKGQPHAKFVTATFALEPDDVEAVKAVAGKCVTDGVELTYSVDYKKAKYFSLDVDEGVGVKHFASTSELSDETKAAAASCKTFKAFEAALQSAKDDAKAKELLGKVQPIATSGLGSFVWEKALKARLPKIMYFDDYRIMAGKAGLDLLSNNGELNKPEYQKQRTLRDLLDVAGVAPDSLKMGANYEKHIRLLRNMANSISDEVFEYWTQNREEKVPKGAPKHAQSSLDVLLDVDGHSQTLHVRINNKRHRVDVDFDERSRGFVWFFSFLAAFRKIVEDHQKLVILLDEPGLNLHGKAQDDLLRFIEERLAAKGHQVIYTTHSPFMIEPHRLDRVRTVEDKIDIGTRVSRNWAEAEAGTVFPLQAALGYDLAQTLFIGPNSLAVEGPSDLLYLQSMSAVLEGMGRTGLDSKWTITPVGGSGKLSTFVALLGSNDRLNIAVLMDYKKADDQHIKEIRETGKLNKNHLVLYSDFAGKQEADVEDMFDAPSYLAFVKAAYPSANDIAEAKLGQHPRLAYNVAEYLKSKGLKEPFHFKPAQEAAKLLGDKVKPAKETLDRFEELFKHLNKLLKK